MAHRVPGVELGDLGEPVPGAEVMLGDRPQAVPGPDDYRLECGHVLPLTVSRLVLPGHGGRRRRRRGRRGRGLVQRGQRDHRGQCAGWSRAGWSRVRTGRHGQHHRRGRGGGQHRRHRVAERHRGQRDQLGGEALQPADPQPRGPPPAQQGHGLGEHGRREQGPGAPADVADRGEEHRAGVAVQQAGGDLVHGRQPPRERAAAEPVQRQRQANDQDQQRERGGQPAGGSPGAAGHAPGPVTPASSEATAEPVALTELIPMRDSTWVGLVMVTVTRIEARPCGTTVPVYPPPAR